MGTPTVILNGPGPMLTKAQFLHLTSNDGMVGIGHLISGNENITEGEQSSLSFLFSFDLRYDGKDATHQGTMPVLEPPDDNNDDFHNYYDEVNSINEEDLMSPPFLEVFGDASTWVLPKPYLAIVRTYDRKTKKVRERAYKRERAARNFIHSEEMKRREVVAMTEGLMYANSIYKINGEPKDVV